MLGETTGRKYRPAELAETFHVTEREKYLLRAVVRLFADQFSDHGKFGGTPEEAEQIIVGMFEKRLDQLVKVVST